MSGSPNQNKESSKGQKCISILDRLPLVLVASLCPPTGMIKLRQRLPSTPRLYILKVLATDGGGLTSAVQATVSISLLDPNQHPPEFSLSLYRFSVPEDADVFTPVGTVEATTENAGTVHSVYSCL